MITIKFLTGLRTIIGKKEMKIAYTGEKSILNIIKEDILIMDKSWEPLFLKPDGNLRDEISVIVNNRIEDANALVTNYDVVQLLTMITGG